MRGTNSRNDLLMYRVGQQWKRQHMVITIVSWGICLALTHHYTEKGIYQNSQEDLGFWPIGALAQTVAATDTEICNPLEICSHWVMM